MLGSLFKAHARSRPPYTVRDFSTTVCVEGIDERDMGQRSTSPSLAFHFTFTSALCFAFGVRLCYICEVFNQSIFVQVVCPKISH